MVWYVVAEALCCCNISLDLHDTSFCSSLLSRQLKLSANYIVCWTNLHASVTGQFQDDWFMSFNVARCNVFWYSANVQIYVYFICFSGVYGCR